MEKKAETTNTFAAAFFKLQKELKPALKESENPGFKGSKYADLGSVWDAIREPLQNNQFAIIQRTDFDNDNMWLETTLVHAPSDGSIAGRYPLRPTKLDPQGYGSALTYARRYSITAMLGVIAEDDDGNAASAKPAPAAPKPTPVADAPKPQDEPEAPSTAQKQAAANWCYEAKDHVLSVETRNGLEAWVAKNAKTLDKAKPLAPNAHKALCDAIEKRQGDLHPMAAQ